MLKTLAAAALAGQPPSRISIAVLADMAAVPASPAASPSPADVASDLGLLIGPPRLSLPLAPCCPATPGANGIGRETAPLGRCPRPWTQWPWTQWPGPSPVLPVRK